MTQLLALRVSAMMGFMAVSLGAFGAHSLSSKLALNGTAAIWEKAVIYHFIHTIILFFLARSPTFQRGPWILFLAGIVIFSGSLYVLAATNIRWLGAITPLGGLSLLAGWLWLAISASVPAK